MKPPVANNDRRFNRVPVILPKPAVRSLSSLRARAFDLHVAGHGNGRFPCRKDCCLCREREELETEIHAHEYERTTIRNDQY